MKRNIRLIEYIYKRVLDEAQRDSVGFKKFLIELKVDVKELIKENLGLDNEQESYVECLVDYIYHIFHEYYQETINSAS